MVQENTLEVRHRAIMININQLFREHMGSLELYEATRGIWVVGQRREKADYAMTVYKGVIREVYRISAWYPAGTLLYKTRDASEFKNTKRWEFEGVVAEEIREEYLGKFIGLGGQNPISYKNC